MASDSDEPRNTDFISEDVAAWLAEHDLEMRNGFEAQKGDIVICSVNGNWSDPCDMGKVLKVCPKGVNLPRGHRDGPVAHVYVLTYKKQKLRGRKKLEGVIFVLYKSHVHALFVMFCFFVFVFFFVFYCLCFVLFFGLLLLILFSFLVFVLLFFVFC